MPKEKKGKDGKSLPDSSMSTGDIFGDLIQALNRRRAGIAEKQADKPSTHHADEFALPETAEEDWAV